MAIPEGLPLAVLISLQFSISELQNVHNALIRKPDATEVMGGCTEICSDKTGTLTANKMTTMAIWVEGKVHDEYEARNAGLGNNHKLVGGLGSFKDIAHDVFINSDKTRYIEKLEGPKENQVMVARLKGNPTEVGLLNYLKDCGFDISNENADVIKNNTRIFVTPFNSEKKFATVGYRREDGSVRICVKGAPDFVGKRCTKLL
jgi:Ca2+-transporting ATPase